jgi:hypothetical protein
MMRWSLKKSIALPREAAEYILRNLFFFGFLVSLVICYVYIVHQGQGKVRTYQTLKKEVKEMRWEYMTMRSDLMVISTRSRLDADIHQGQVRTKGKSPIILKTN